MSFTFESMTIWAQIFDKKFEEDAKDVKQEHATEEQKENVKQAILFAERLSPFL